MSTIKTILVLIKLNAMLKDQHIGWLVTLSFHWAKTQRDFQKNCLRYLTNEVIMSFTLFTQNLLLSLRRSEYL